MINWKVAHYTSATGTGGKSLTWWSKQIEERSDGRIKLDIYFSEELVKQTEMLKSVRSGAVDAAYCGISLYPEYFPFSNVCYIPFLPLRRVDHQILVMNEMVRTSLVIQEELDKQNVVFGYNYSSPYYELIGNKPIRTTADLKGVRIKCMPAVAGVFQSFGAIPVWFGAPQTFAALERGDLDVVNFAGPVGMYDWGLHKVAKYFMGGVSISGSRSNLLINKDSWNALPGDIRDIIEGLRSEFARVLQSLYSDTQAREEALDAFKAEGIELIELPHEERAKLVAAAAGAQGEWVDKNGGEPARQVLRAYIAAKEKVEAEYPEGIA